MAENHCELIVFGRYPRVGRVKTRLIPSLGPARAALLQKRLTEATISAARETIRQLNGRLVFCHDGGSQNKIAAWLGKSSADWVRQSSGDLGKRMLTAFQRSFNKGAGRVLLIGTDIPGITSQLLEGAFEALNNHDLVLGPSTDGGYWLVGMNKPQDIFSNMAWSRPDVLENTWARANEIGMKSFFLETLTDLDTEEDLKQASLMGNQHSPYVSVIIPTLNEERWIVETIRRARSEDAEILISDGGSTDRTIDLANRSGARIVSGKKGRAGQLNRAAAVAKGEVFFFLHADTKPPEQYVEHIFDSLMDRKAVLGAFRFDTDLETPAMKRIGYWTNVRAKLFNLPYGDQGFFLRKRDFRSVGGFPDVPIAEDLYLARKMVGLGRLVIAPASAVTSGRRWERLGPMRTTLVNTLIAAGCLVGIPPHRLAALYQLPKRRTVS